MFASFLISSRVNVLPSSPLRVTFPASALILSTSWSAVRLLTSSIFSSTLDSAEHFDKSRATMLYLLLVVAVTA